MKPLVLHLTCALAALFLAGPLTAQVPNLIGQQGRVSVNGVNFDGTGQFKFALVNAAGTVTYWSNDGTSTAGSQPATAVSLPVTKGLYSVQLGDASLTNMTAVPASVLASAEVRVRVWFNNGALGFQQLTPDQRLATNGYLPDGSVTSAKLAPGASPPPLLVSGTSQNAAANASYLAGSAAPATFNLPPTANAGDVISISGLGAGGWTAQTLYPDAWTPRPNAGTREWVSVASSSDGTKLVAASVGFDVPGADIYTSTDSGQTWNARVGARIAWTAVASSADGMTLVATSVQALVVIGGAPSLLHGRLYVSTDGGFHWNSRDGDRNWTAAASSADGVRLAAVDAGGRIYTSINSGLSWTPREASRPWAAITSSLDGMKLAAATGGGQIYTSTDAGVNWTPRETNRNWTAIASSADGMKLVASVTGGQLSTSVNGGGTWTPREISRPWKSVASSADGVRLVAVEAGGKIHISTDSGATWTARESSRNWQSAAASADGSKLVAVVNGGQIFTDGGGGFGGWLKEAASGASGTATTLQFSPENGWQRQTTNNLASDAVTSASMASGAVTAASLAPGAVTAAALAPEIGLWDSFGGTVFRSGYVGIGISIPAFPLSLGGDIQNTKLALYDSGASVYGMGIGSGQFRLHVDAPTARFSFLDAPNGSERLTIEGGGDVGIGIADPAARLDVDTGGAGRVQIRNEGNFVPAINVTGGPLPGYLRFRHSFEIWPNDAGTAPGRMDIRNAAGAPTIFMDGGTGRIGAGRDPAANRLEVEGDASKTTAGAWLANSDRRIKTDIQPVKDALDTIEKIEPVTFRYTEEYRKAHPDIKDVPYYNVIAQEFREVFPNAVKSSGEKLPDGSEILQVDTYPATITALAAIKELKAENEALKQRLATLEELVHKMSATGPAAQVSNAPSRSAP